MQINIVFALALSAVALTPVACKADDEQQGREACMYDAPTVCAQFIPDRQRTRIVSCRTARASPNRAAS
jgi:hypothetical protein